LVPCNLNGRRYQNETVAPVMIPHIRANRVMSLAQDNAPCHTARGTMQMLKDNLIIVRPWPAKSPDLNPIEHLWDMLKRRIRRHPPPNNVADLERLATEGWENIIQRAIQRFIMSMRAQWQAVIAAAGGHTQY